MLGRRQSPALEPSVRPVLPDARPLAALMASAQVFCAESIRIFHPNQPGQIISHGAIVIVGKQRGGPGHALLQGPIVSRRIGSRLTGLGNRGVVSFHGSYYIKPILTSS